MTIKCEYPGCKDNAIGEFRDLIVIDPFLKPDVYKRKLSKVINKKWVYHYPCEEHNNLKGIQKIRESKV